MQDGEMEFYRVHDRLIARQGDLTREDTDAIVNAANASLLGGGGVDGAIHRAGGAEILAACREIRSTRYPKGLPTGEVVSTTAGHMPSRRVIHTVGPIYGQNAGDDARLLASCYEKAIDLAASEGLATIAFPAISTGAFGYPRNRATSIALGAVDRALMRNEGIREVRLVFSDAEGVALVARLMSARD
jgi:O-acetyl-ADP-ribose deacetylase (regulator of RNase III)